MYLQRRQVNHRKSQTTTPPTGTSAGRHPSRLNECPLPTAGQPHSNISPRGRRREHARADRRSANRTAQIPGASPLSAGRRQGASGRTRRHRCRQDRTSVRPGRVRSVRGWLGEPIDSSCARPGLISKEARRVVRSTRSRPKRKGMINNATHRGQHTHLAQRPGHLVESPGRTACMRGRRELAAGNTSTHINITGAFRFVGALLFAPPPLHSVHVNNTTFRFVTTRPSLVLGRYLVYIHLNITSASLRFPLARKRKRRL